MSVSVEVVGAKELVKQLEKAGGDVIGASAVALRAGARVVQQAANEKAPGPHIEIGNVEGRGLAAEIAIGPDDEHWYYRFAERGTTPHTITGNPLHFFTQGEEVFAEFVPMHPGQTAKPFLRPALDENEGRVAEAVGDEIKKRLPKSGR